ncbi:MAG: ATP-binding protein [Bacilli bacterium]|nr:MAG: ATP-binding protein [Bacilli bacterium]
MRGYNGTEEVEYGEYPQYAADSRMQSILESEYNRGMNKTGRSYTFDSVKYDDYDTGFKPVAYEEYEYQGKKYIRIRANSDFEGGKFKLSNGVEYRNGDYVWVEVSPVKWLIDDRARILISKMGLVSGIRFLDKRTNYKGDFSRTEMKEYLDRYMIHDLTQTATFTRVQDMTPEEKERFEEKRKQVEKRRNPYGLKFGQVSEEEIIKGAIESGVAVFLHGPSSEGKSARVKQIDPTCEIIYLRNATPESLNGKSVYNGSTGEMMDVPPTWLKKLQEKCEKEPDRLHVVFFDEITNALPSIQGIAFNIVLDREVNGIWKLPENARIVAAGNDMKDSLAANQLAEPLFNRFAHVYIKTTTESWLKWASEHNIHPAIYSYIAYKKGETLRSKYDGEKPNADPRKWEMASKMLYATGSPEMLRALVGEDITREFVEFCNQQVITLDDVINGNYTDRDIQALNTAERYATTIGLSQVDDTNLEKVRGFVAGLGAEFGAIFDALWTHGDESKLERLAEAKLAEMPGGGIRR